MSGNREHTMNWAEELQRAFMRLDKGEAVRVAFAERDGFEGELGQDFNEFAEEIRGLPAGPLTREERHRLRNRLAGVLAAVHVLGSEESAEPGGNELAKLAEAAKRIDIRLCDDNG